MKLRTFLLSALLAVGIASPAVAGPVLLPVQGVLRDHAGELVTESDLEVTFRLYDGASLLHEETQTLSVADGILVAYLGDDDALEAAVLAAAASLSLEVIIGGETMGALDLGVSPHAAFADQCATLSGDGIASVVSALGTGAVALGAGSTVGGEAIATRAELPDDAAIAAALDGVPLSLGAGTTLNGQSIASIPSVRADFAVNAVALSAGSTVGGASIATANDLLSDDDVVDAVEAVAVRLAPGSTLGAEPLATTDLLPTEDDVEGYITNGAIALASGSTVGGRPVQARVTGNCSVGQSIRAINSDGTVVCDAPTSRTVALYVNGESGGCTIDKAIGGSATCTRISTANYLITFATGTFSEAPICTGSRATIGLAVQISETTATSVQIATFRQDAIAQEGDANLICIGDI